MISLLPPNMTPLKLLHMPILTNSFLKNSLYTVFHISLLPYECRINLWKSYYFGHLSNQNVEVSLRYGFCHKISFYFLFFACPCVGLSIFVHFHREALSTLPPCKHNAWHKRIKHNSSYQHYRWRETHTGEFISHVLEKNNKQCM